MIFLRLKHFLKLINDYRRKENTQLAMWQPLGMPCVRLTSARGRSYADVIMAIDDVNIGLVNIDQVNRVYGQRVSCAHISATVRH